MRVFNLTDKPLDYRGKLINPEGGFIELPDMTFVPDRDKALVAKKVIAFGQLPSWFETHLKLKRVTQLADQLVKREEARPPPSPRRRKSPQA